MLIVVDRHIPFIEGVFEAHGVDVVYSECIDPTGADALIIRTRTRCDEKLLRGHSPRIIATATIGYDHIDMQYCRDHGIVVATAAGCNARGVAQWFFAAIAAMGADPVRRQTTIGVVGVGNVGSVVDRVARSAGFRTLLCDPPLAEHRGGFVTLEHLLAESDIVTIHTPLNETTCSMANADFFARMRRDALFLNSSRGEVVDERALMESHIEKFALDVWGGEPLIDSVLLSCAAIATPHVAGYSLQGKAAGTAMSVRSVARVLGISALESWYPPQVRPTIPNNDISWQQITAMMPVYYDIMVDDRALRVRPSDFEKQRSNYDYRTEFF